MWRRVALRRVEALDVLNRAMCTTASELARRLGISHMQSYYVLTLLEREGKIVRHRTGRVHVWCVPSVREVYTIISPCLKYADRALEELVRKARGSVATLTPGGIIKAVERLFHAECAAPLGRPHLLAAVKAWLEARLGDAVVGVRRRETRVVQYIVDVRKARERLQAAAAAAV
jgi:hypothetical protein